MNVYQVTATRKGFIVNVFHNVRAESADAACEAMRVHVTPGSGKLTMRAKLYEYIERNA